MTNKLYALGILVFSILNLYSQPHIEGNIAIDMKSGLIRCDLTLKNLPALKSYDILLNKGMNVRYFKDTEGLLIDYAGDYDGEIKGEALAYQLKTKHNTLPERFRINYVGAFPVYASDYHISDFKGLIAFNGKTLRASEQTKWYPVFYDKSEDKIIQNYTYQLKVSINGGNAVFINGSAPKKGNQLEFSSDRAYPLLLFAGHFDFVEHKGDFIINDTLSNLKATLFFENINKVKQVLIKAMNTQFEDNIYLIKHQPVDEREAGSSWGFNTYPSFAFTGLDFADLVNESGQFSENMYKFFGHEFAHNYFGNNMMSGKWAWFWTESLAEYLSFEVSASLCDPSFLNAVLNYHINKVKPVEFVPLGQIEQAKQIDELYRYSLGPLILKCFELKFGKIKAHNVIHSLYTYSFSETLTIAHWRKASLAQGITNEAFDAYESEFIDNPSFKDNVVKYLLTNKLK